MISLPTTITLTALIIIPLMIAIYLIKLPLVLIKKRLKSNDKSAKVLLELKKYPIFAPGLLVSFSLLVFIIFAIYISQHLDFVVSLIWLIGLMVGLFLCLPLNFIFKRPIEDLLFFYLKFIYVIYPKIQLLRKVYKRIYASASFSDFYDKNDLIKFLEQQLINDRANLSKTDIETAVSVLSFDRKLVKDFYTPNKVVRFVSDEEMISPILMDELHKSGFSRFPVYHDDKDSIIGTLYLRDLVGKRLSGRVATIASNDVYEISDEASLENALKHFLKTHHHLFIVKNNFHEVLGVITIEDAIEQLIGRSIVDESDKHENMRDYAKQ